jgi:subtilase family serine protease
MGATRASCIAHGIPLLLLLLAASVSHAQTTGRAAEERVVLPGHTLAAAAQAPRVAPSQTVGGEIEVTIALRRSDEAGFARHLVALYDPSSTEFRRFLSPIEVSDRFGPSADDYAAVRDYLTQAGLTIVADSPNRMTISARGSRDAVQQTFAVTINDHVTGAHVYHAAENEPSLPASVAMRVQAISGLTAMAPPRRLGEAIKQAI